MMQIGRLEHADCVVKAWNLEGKSIHIVHLLHVNRVQKAEFKTLKALKNLLFLSISRFCFVKEKELI